MKKVGSEVYSLPVFKKDFTKIFLEELQHFKLSGIHHEQPNSMNRHGIILDEIGFKSFFDLVSCEILCSFKIWKNPEFFSLYHCNWITSCRYEYRRKFAKCCESHIFNGYSYEMHT